MYKQEGRKNVLHLFAGVGGGVLGGQLLGHTPVCAVEIEQYCRKVLLQRQRDGILPKFPIWDDIKTFDGKPWSGTVDIVCGGFPCQDISSAGGGAGLEGKRSGLWSEMARVVGEIKPRYVFVENSPMLTRRGLGRVLMDLAQMGYDAEWGVLGAHHAGAPHKRDRIWILGMADSVQPRQQWEGGIQRSGKNTETMGEASTNAESTGKGPGVLADSCIAGLEGQPGNVGNRNQPGRVEEKANRPVGEGRISWWDIDPADVPDARPYTEGAKKNLQSEEQNAVRKNTGNVYSSQRKSGSPVKPRLG